MFPWLAPYTPWNGGMLAHCDYVTLDEAARFASGHAGVEITTTDFLRAAGRGQIQMLAICDRVVTWEPCHVTSVPTTTDRKMLFRLPIEACKALSQTGSANWRTIESYEHVKTLGDVLCRFTCWQLPETEPDLKTTSDECRLTGYEVHSLSDAFIKEPQPTPEQTTATPAPVGAGNEPVKHVNAMKKAALIAALEYEWPSIVSDISEATRNGLKAAAHTGKHGEWDKDKARAWAVSNGKIKQSAPVHSLAAAWSGTTTRPTNSG